MGLLDRLRGNDPVENRISAHGFQAALHEWADGAAGFSRATIISEFGLTTEDESELDTVKAIRDTANTDAKRARFDKAFDSILMLASDSSLTFYNTNASVVTRLNEAVA